MPPAADSAGCFSAVFHDSGRAMPPRYNPAPMPATLPASAAIDATLLGRMEGHVAASAGIFERELVSDLECVNHLARHVEHYRGKMLRPQLVVAVALALDETLAGRAQAVETLAAVVEMVHMATLVHDDVLDEADLRRSGATINALRGNEAAVMLGDWLISHSYHLCASLANQALSRAVADATNTLCAGELLQLSHRNDWNLAEADYFDIIGRKTGALTAVSCQLPALLGLGNARQAQLLRQFGWDLGVAFQMADDLIDLTASEEEAGKSVARDLAKGKLTLPLIHALASSRGPEAAQLRQALDVLAGAVGGDADAARACVQAAVARADGVGHAKRRAQEVIRRALAALEEALPDSPARRLLALKTSAVLERKR